MNRSTSTPSASASSLGLLLSRRTLIAGAAAGVAAALMGLQHAHAATNSAEDFHRLSVFLTGGKPLDHALADRYLASLRRHDKTFDDGFSALASWIASTHMASVDDLLKAPAMSDALHKTATQIVSAWYLGVVGEGADAELISYEQALMYRPTHGVLVIPSYGGGPNSWGSKPV